MLKTSSIDIEIRNFFFPSLFGKTEEEVFNSINSSLYTTANSIFLNFLDVNNFPEELKLPKSENSFDPKHVFIYWCAEQNFCFLPNKKMFIPLDIIFIKYYSQELGDYLITEAFQEWASSVLSIDKCSMPKYAQFINENFNCNWFYYPYSNIIEQFYKKRKITTTVKLSNDYADLKNNFTTLEFDLNTLKNELDKSIEKFENSKYDLLTFLGIFIALFTFTSLNIQFLSSSTATVARFFLVNSVLSSVIILFFKILFSSIKKKGENPIGLSYWIFPIILMFLAILSKMFIFIIF